MVDMRGGARVAKAIPRRERRRPRSVRLGYPSEAAAFRAAVDAAHVEGIRGSEAEVLVATAKNKFRLKWKFGRDPYPPT